MSKRQRIDATEPTNKKDVNQRAFGAISNGSLNTTQQQHHINENPTPPDILPTIISNHDSKSTINTLNLNNHNGGSTISLSNESTNDELDNAATTSIIFNAIDQVKNSSSMRKNLEFPDLLKTSSDTLLKSTSGTHLDDSSSSSSTVNCVDAMNSVPGCSSNINSTNSIETSIRLSVRDSNNFNTFNNIDDFQLHLMKQCLCHISKRSLRRPFCLQYNTDPNGNRYRVRLINWPAHKLIQFLSNVELLFEIYLSQNAKGEICTRIMQACDSLLTDKVDIIQDIFDLDEYNDKFVQYLAIKVLANCMLICKDKKDYCDNLLEILIGNLCSIQEPIDSNLGKIALGKIAFTLGIILHIMNWKDIKKHPSDDQIVINGREVYNDSDNENFTIPLDIPTIEMNPFAAHHTADNNDTNIASTQSSIHHNSSHSNVQNNENQTNQTTSQARANDSRSTSCQLQSLKDSDSFDSKDLKYSLTLALSNKWPKFVDDMAKCIEKFKLNRNLYFIENTVITFLMLWERIINVDTCISFESTLQFHETLIPFEKILIGGNLPVHIYEQILTLFSASLCYTTTLALQNEVPPATTRLAIEIFNHVKNRKIFSSLPLPDTEARNDISFIGYKHSTIVYELNSSHDNDDDLEFHTDNNVETHPHKSIDFILLQKLVLLIMKAIVVTVCPIRSGDSSDSSMDSCSSNSSSVDQDALTIERITRDVVKELKIFLRNKLHHHPETHLSKVIVHLFDTEDSYLIEAMLCMLGTTITFLPRQPPFGSIARQSNTTTANERNQFRELIDMINPVYTFLEFLESIKFQPQTLLDLLITDETCFLLYLLRFVKYIRNDWPMFQNRCSEWMSLTDTPRTRSDGSLVIVDVMTVLIQLRLKLERLVLRRLFPYEISPLISAMKQCESLYEGEDLI